MGFAEIREKLSEALKKKNAEYKEAQQVSEARDDYETVDKALRNKRREVRRYIDQDEKAQLESYLRARRAQEDRSWMNPTGMLDNQEINISRAKTNIFTNDFNPHKINPNQPNNIIQLPNRTIKKIGGRRR